MASKGPGSPGLVAWMLMLVCPVVRQSRQFRGGGGGTVVHGSIANHRRGTYTQKSELVCRLLLASTA